MIGRDSAARAQEAINAAYRLLQGDPVNIDIEKQYEALQSAMHDLWTHPDPDVDFEIRDESRFLFTSLNVRVAALEPLVVQKWAEEDRPASGK